MTLPDRQRWQQLTPLLDELLDLDRPARQSRLASLRRTDAATADELTAMLAAADDADAVNFLSGDAQGGAQLPHALAGQTIGAYLVEGPLGEGGTGSVWRARRADGRYDGEVALKLLHLSLVGRVGAQRFEREGAILARLTHPNIARLLDAGVTDAGQPYLVLELVDGERIDRHCDAHRLTLEQRLALFDDVLAAVAHAHSHLVIHRDIKPNNILVTREGRVKLLDFGIAKLIEGDRDAAPLTAEGLRALTPEYAAPEQLQGAPVTTATDVYALGVLLYQLLTGRHPTAPAGAGTAELLRATLGLEPPRLAAALGSETAVQAALDRGTSPARLRRELHGDLDTIVARALRKDPAQRFQTVAALADDLRRYRAHEPVMARPDSLAYRAAKFMRRHRGAMAAVSAVAIAVAAGIAGTLTQADEARQQARAARAAAMRADAQARIAERERAVALRSLTQAEAADEFMRFVLSQSSRQPLTMSELLGRSAQAIDRQFADDPGLQASLQLAVADLYGELLEFDQADALLRQARTAADRANDPALAAQIDCTAAALGEAIGRADGSRALDEAIARLRALPGAGGEALVDCLNQRSIHHYHQGDATAAVADATEALQRLGPPRPGRRALAADLRGALGMAHGMLGAADAAIADYETAIAELDRLGRGGTTSALTLRNNLGVVFTRAGAWQRADAVLQAALARAAPTDTVSRQLLEPNEARVLALLGRPAEARPLAERALASSRVSDNLRARGYSALTAALVACTEARLAVCGTRIDEARMAFDRLQPPDRSGLASVALMAGTLALQQKAPAAARVQLEQARAILSAEPGGSAALSHALALLARADLGLRDVDAAGRHAAQAVSAARGHGAGSAASGWLGEALLVQARAEQARGDRAAARRSLADALVQIHEAVGDGAPMAQEAQALSQRLAREDGAPGERHSPKKVSRNAQAAAERPTILFVACR